MATKVIIINQGYGGNYYAGKNTVRNADGTFTINGSSGEIGVFETIGTSRYRPKNTSDCSDCGSMFAHGYESFPDNGYIIYTGVYADCYLEIKYPDGKSKKVSLAPSKKIRVPLEPDASSVKLFCGGCFEEIKSGSGRAVFDPSAIASYRYECIGNGDVRYYIKNISYLGYPVSFLFMRNNVLQHSIVDVALNSYYGEESIWDFNCDWTDIRLVGTSGALNLTHKCICSIQVGGGGPITP